jgi:hypothetical protein
MLLYYVIFCSLVFVISANLYTFFVFLRFFCSISIGQSYVLSGPVCSGIAFQPSHCILPLKNLTAASISSSVLRETFKVNLSLMIF